MAVRNSQPKRVAVIGGGIAGLSAAIHLTKANSSIEVSLFERFDLLGGKLKGWETRVEGAGRNPVYSQPVEHGMHGWWENYLNFVAFLRGDGVSVGKDGDDISPVDEFIVVDAKAVKRDSPSNLTWTKTTLNKYAWVVDREVTSTLWDLFKTFGFIRLLAPCNWRRALRLLITGIRGFGLFTMFQFYFLGIIMRCRALLWIVARLHKRYRLLFAFLSSKPPEWLDRLNLAEFIRQSPLREPVASLLILFQSMLTYGDHKRISAYHVARCLDFYGLRHRDAIWFYLCRDSAHKNVVSVMERVAKQRKVVIRRYSPVTKIEPAQGGHQIVFLDGDKCVCERFDYVVCALDIPGTKRLFGNSPRNGSPEWKNLVCQVDRQETTFVVVVRVWMKNPISNLHGSIKAMAMVRRAGSCCPFDFVFFLSRSQKAPEAFGGEVIEFHLPGEKSVNGEEIDLNQEAVVNDVINWASKLFPSLNDGDNKVVHVALNYVRTFSESPAEHLSYTPEIQTGIDGLYLCGDWIRYDSPIAYMEKAFVTGLEAARKIRVKEGLPEPPVRPLQEATLGQDNADWITDKLSPP